jgi:hypothetical protein
LPQTIQLEPKDQPVLLAAINGKAHYLLTGDAETDRGRPGLAACGRRSILTGGNALESGGSPCSFGWVY